MVSLQRMVVNAISRARHELRGDPPLWVDALFDRLNQIERKVNLIMSLNVDTLNRILAGAASLVQQAKTAADTISTLTTKVSDLQSQLGQEQAQDVQDAKDQADANDALSKTADALDTLLQSPQTPETPVVPAPVDAPGVISGDTPVEGGAIDVSGVTDDGSGSAPLSTDAPAADGSANTDGS